MYMWRTIYLNYNKIKKVDRQKYLDQFWPTSQSLTTQKDIRRAKLASPVVICIDGVYVELDSIRGACSLIDKGIVNRYIQSIYYPDIPFYSKVLFKWK